MTGVGSGRSAAQIAAEVARRDKAVAGELALVRARAASYAKGAGALLAGALGFSLIKGRSDLSELQQDYAIAVGALLAATILIGTAACIPILRAAYGPLKGVSPDVSDHSEVLRTVMALRVGLGIAAVAVMCLFIAIALTWYGPDASGPKLQITPQGGQPVCGGVVRSGSGTITVKDHGQDVEVDLSTAVRIEPVDSCS